MTDMALGDPLPLDDALLDQAAQIDDVDVVHAQSFWRNALKAGVLAYLWSLLDARTVVAVGAVASPFGWNPLDRMYMRPNGGTLPEVRVRSAVEQAISVQAATVQRLTAQLQDGTLTLAEWQANILQTLKSGHLAAAAAAKGGWAQMDQGAYGWVGQRLRVQYGYLRRFAQQIADGTQPLDAVALRRATMYADATRQTHQEMLRREAISAGDAYEHNALGVADHCEGCLDATRQGWVPIGTLPATGTRVCLTSCRCHLVYRSAAEQAAA